MNLNALVPLSIFSPETEFNLQYGLTKRTAKLFAVEDAQIVNCETDAGETFFSFISKVEDAAKYLARINGKKYEVRGSRNYRNKEWIEVNKEDFDTFVERHELKPVRDYEFVQCEHCLFSKKLGAEINQFLTLSGLREYRGKRYDIYVWGESEDTILDRRSFEENLFAFSPTNMKVYSSIKEGFSNRDVPYLITLGDYFPSIHINPYFGLSSFIQTYYSHLTSVIEIAFNDIEKFLKGDEELKEKFREDFIEFVTERAKNDSFILVTRGLPIYFGLSLEQLDSVDTILSRIYNEVKGCGTHTVRYQHRGTYVFHPFPKKKKGEVEVEIEVTEVKSEERKDLEYTEQREVVVGFNPNEIPIIEALKSIQEEKPRSEMTREKFEELQRIKQYQNPDITMESNGEGQV